jgi:hypothetical protein
LSPLQRVCNPFDLIQIPFNTWGMITTLPYSLFTSAPETMGLIHALFAYYHEVEGKVPGHENVESNSFPKIVVMMKQASFLWSRISPLFPADLERPHVIITSQSSFMLIYRSSERKYLFGLSSLSFGGFVV